MKVSCLLKTVVLLRPTRVNHPPCYNDHSTASVFVLDEAELSAEVAILPGRLVAVKHNRLTSDLCMGQWY